MQYKVVKEEGVTVDGVEFANGEVLDLEPEAFNLPELLAEGSLVEVSEEENEDVGGEGDEVLPETPEAPAGGAEEVA